MTVVVVVGRRIDAPDAPAPQFPVSSVPVVAAAIHQLLQKVQVTTLVSSAACGVDLLAIRAATTLGARTRIVLPFSADRFKVTSVTDRPGSWETLYDRAIQRAAQAVDLVNLELPDNEQAYLDVNERLIDEALQVAGTGVPHAVIVWNGPRSGGLDVTAHLARCASTANFYLHTLPIPTERGKQ